MSVSRTLKSSIGAKWLMAASGLGLLLFVIAHMIGNLQVFLGRDKLNHYAEAIQAMGMLLWIARLGLFALLVLHVVTAFKLTAANRAARPVPYVMAQRRVTSYAARTMLMSGLIVLAFVAYHLAHFTFGWTDPQGYGLHETVLHTEGIVAEFGKSYERHDVYGMVVAGFQQPIVSILYVVAQFLLAMHIWHGASSMLQTFGVTHPALKVVKGSFGMALATLIFLGNVSIPLAVLFGWVKP